MVALRDLTNAGHLDFGALKWRKFYATSEGSDEATNRRVSLDRVISIHAVGLYEGKIAYESNG